MEQVKKEESQMMIAELKEQVEKFARSFPLPGYDDY